MPKTPLELEIHINEEGEVILTELPREMAEMVMELDPDHTIGCTLQQSSSPPESPEDNASSGSEKK